MLFSVIVACTLDGGIGYNNKLPWDIKNELKLFKRITETTQENKENVIIMGRKTFFSLNEKPLKNRINIVISKTYILNHDYSNLYIFSNIDMALNYCEFKRDNINKVFIIGGKSIYDECFEKYYNKIEHVYLSIIYKKYLCDTFINIKKILKDFKPIFNDSIFDKDFLYITMKNKCLLSQSNSLCHLDNVDKC
jgi:dihydrofolate reductase